MARFTTAMEATTTTTTGEPNGCEPSAAPSQHKHGGEFGEGKGELATDDKSLKMLPVADTHFF